uniref:Uncharacterized protein n=1 Tax=Cannabis sativa TaxID=3483 RepID=A0A803Q6Q0_CANSA
MKRYNQATPPAYDMSKIPKDFPLFMSYGKNDYLSDVKDVEVLLETIKDHDKDKLAVQYLENYAHMDFVMGEPESLKSYIQPFNAEEAKVKDVHKNLTKRKSEPGGLANPRAHEESQKKMEFDGGKNDRNKRVQREEEPRHREFTYYIGITCSKERIFMANKHRVPFKKLPPMRKDSSKRDPNKFCKFCKDIGHTTEECTHLHLEMEDRIQRGYLGGYRREERCPKERREGAKAEHPHEAPKVIRDVRTICGGPRIGGDIRKGRDRYAWEAQQPPMVMNLEQRPSRTQKRKVTL